MKFKTSEMTEETIISKWRIGKTTLQIANDYMKKYNKEAEKKKETKITKLQALEHVEPIIFKYQTSLFKK